MRSRAAHALAPRPLRGCCCGRGWNRMKREHTQPFPLLPTRSRKEFGAMSEQDAEIEWLKAEVNCAALLERLPPVWRLDRAESTRRSLKYRRGEGEIIIVNHDGRGWWDPLSDAKGDIFTLVRHLDPGLTFPEARRVLHEFVGIAPAFPEMIRTRRTRASSVPIGERWERCQKLSC